MPVPSLVILRPPRFRNPKGSITAKFRGAEERGTGLAEAYVQVASELGCRFFDAETVTTASLVDGIHLDSDQHLKLGVALAKVVNDMIAPTERTEKAT
jgi:hypothetical protein